MSKKNEDNIERFFRKAVKQYDTPFMESDWQKMEKMLDEQAIESAGLLRRKHFRQAGFSLILLLLISSGVLFFLSVKNKDVSPLKNQTSEHPSPLPANDEVTPEFQGQASAGEVSTEEAKSKSPDASALSSNENAPKVIEEIIATDPASLRSAVSDRSQVTGKVDGESSPDIAEERSLSGRMVENQTRNGSPMKADMISGTNTKIQSHSGTSLIAGENAEQSESRDREGKKMTEPDIHKTENIILAEDQKKSGSLESEAIDHNDGIHKNGLIENHEDKSTPETFGGAGKMKKNALVVDEETKEGDTESSRKERGQKQLIAAADLLAEGIESPDREAKRDIEPDAEKKNVTTSEGQKQSDFMVPETVNNENTVIVNNENKSGDRVGSGTGEGETKIDEPVTTITEEEIVEKEKEETKQEETSSTREGQEQEQLLPTRWNVALIVAPDFTSTALGKYTAPGRALGVTAGYRIFSRLTISTGLIISTKKYEGFGRDYHPPKGYWQNKTNGVIPEEISGTCEVYEIPIALQYMVHQNRKNNIYIGAGVSSYLMASQRYVYTYENPNPGAAKGWSTSESSSYPFNIAHFSLAYERQIFSKLAIGLEPYVKIPFTGMGWSDVDLFSTGVFINLRYRFFKKERIIAVKDGN